MSGINHIICAAGTGTRTRAIHPDIPKPLLKIEGVTLLARSLSSPRLTSEDRVIIVSQKDHAVRRAVEGKLKLAHPGVEFEFLEISGLTLGQLDTSLRARPLCDPAKSVAIFNSDTYFQSQDLWTKLKDPALDGVIPCAIEEGDMWSFCRAPGDQDGAVIMEVTEKVRISRWCSVGFYYFRDTGAYFSLAEQELTQIQGKECYVAPAYNAMIQSGARVVLDAVNDFRPMGSVEQIEQYWQKGLGEMRLSQNVPG